MTEGVSRACSGLLLDLCSKSRLILSQSLPGCVQVEGASDVRVEWFLFETVEDFDVQHFF